MFKVFLSCLASSLSFYGMSMEYLLLVNGYTFNSHNNFNPYPSFEFDAGGTLCCFGIAYSSINSSLPAEPDPLGILCIPGSCFCASSVAGHAKHQGLVLWFHNVESISLVGFKLKVEPHVFSPPSNFRLLSHSLLIMYLHWVLQGSWAVPIGSSRFVLADLSLLYVCS